MTPKQAEAARKKLAKWDALNKEADELRRFTSDFDSRYVEDSFQLQFDGQPGGLCPPRWIQRSISINIGQWTRQRLSDIEVEKQELKIDG